MTTRSVRDRDTAGAREIESRRLFLSVGLFSAFVNLLMLTGPLFMLQVYDRVLASRSEATLVALVLIVAFLFLMMGLLDHSGRGSIPLHSSLWRRPCRDDESSPERWPR